MISILTTSCFILKFMPFITHSDSPALWHTYLSDPASITIEGILMLDFFLLNITSFVFFVELLLFYSTTKTFSEMPPA